MQPTLIRHNTWATDCCLGYIHITSLFSLLSNLAFIHAGKHTVKKMPNPALKIEKLFLSAACVLPLPQLKCSPFLQVSAHIPRT